MSTAARSFPDGAEPRAPQSPFEPHPAIRSPHVQTVLGSRGRQLWVERRSRAVRAAAEALTLASSDGVRLEVQVSRQPANAPTVILIPGWMGHADSSYVLSAAAHLWSRGFSVARITLPDHGNTAHLNEALFHSAQTREVIEVVQQIERGYATGPCGLAGYSLGGNFALRVAQAHAIDTVAVCPALDPGSTMSRIDTGWRGYRWFFVKKWHRAILAKQTAFPDRYRVDDVLDIRSVMALTERFVADHTDFPTTDDYLAAYTLTGSTLRGTSATVVYAADDPVIPEEDFENLPGSLDVYRSRYGGHCAFVQNPTEATWIDRYLADHFHASLAGEQAHHSR